ncbi:MAG: ATP-binding protein [Desulfatibacillaceae bacterium]|nr:ATP-binding protein [Desulfatibacillaceae bacterium]
MSSEAQNKTERPVSEAERVKRRRELLLMVLAFGLIAALTYAESSIINFGTEIPLSNTVLMFIVININLLLAIFLLYLVLRNLAKLLYERRTGVLGSRLRVKLVIAFMTLSMLPTAALFFFSLQFITTTIEYWFNVPVAQSLENSLSVGRHHYEHLEKNHRFFIERIAYQIDAHNYMRPEKDSDLKHYLRVTQRAFNLDAVEVYSPHLARHFSAQDANLVAEGIPGLAPDEILAEPVDETSVRTFIVTIPEGELVRTIGSVPFGMPRREADAFVAVSTLLSPDLAEKMAAIARGIEEYHQLMLLKEPIKISNYFTLSIVALFIAIFSVWFGMRLAKSLTDPIAQLAQGTRRVAGGDLSFALEKPSDDEMGSLVESFNRMTKDLLTSREQLQKSANQLAQQNVEIEKRRQYMEVVLNSVSTGVVSLDSAGNVTTINKSAQTMLGLDEDDLAGRSYKHMLKGRHKGLVEEVVGRLIHGQAESVRLPAKHVVAGRPRSFMVHVTALKDEKGRHMGMVVAFDDLTEQERAQRMAAWREVARRIAHEVKNPLTPIKLSAQRLARKYSGQIDDSVFEECTKTIIDQVDLIQNLVNEFSAYARFPAPRPVSLSLPALVNEATGPYKEGYPDIQIEVFAQESASIPRLLLDPQQMKRALINLLDNAISAVGGKGSVTVKTSYDKNQGRVILEVADTGKGISPEAKSKLFEPYFSTKKAGMGLGLSIVSTIVTEHNGSIRVEDNRPNGARFIIEFPV